MKFVTFASLVTLVSAVSLWWLPISRRGDVSRVCGTTSRYRFFASLRMTKPLAVILSEAKNLWRTYG